MDIKALQEEAKAKMLKKQEKAKAKVAAIRRPKLIEMPEPTGNPEVDSLADLDAVQAAFRKRAQQEDKRRELATDSEHWFAVCFQTREQKEVFLKALNLIAGGDKYLDGQVVARVLGVDLPPEDVPYLPEGKVDKKWLEFTE